MTTYAKLKLSDLEEAWENECGEVKDVLQRLYPTLLPPPTAPPESEEIDISADIKWRMVPGGTMGGFFLEGFYKGDQIVYVNPSNNYDEKQGVGVRVAWGEEKNYKFTWLAGHTFKITKI